MIRLCKLCCMISFIWLSGQISVSTIFADNQRQKNIHVSLRSKWPGTPLLLEAAELLSKESKALYWEFVDSWVHNDEVSDLYTAKTCLQKILNCSRSLLSQPLVSLFELSLIMRTASPKVVLYRQLSMESLSSLPSVAESETDRSIWSASKANNTGITIDHFFIGAIPKSPYGRCCWVDNGSSLFFEITELKSWISSISSYPKDLHRPVEIFEFDHVHPKSFTLRSPAILYGALGTDCFKQFHFALVEAATEGKIQYVVRPVLPSGCETKVSCCGAIGVGDSLNFGGYGVELALKNMEYKSIDDSTVRKGVTLEDPRIEDLSQDIRGFIFSKILEKEPALAPEIMAFRDHLLSTSVSDALDVWELKDLGFQAAQKIIHAYNPLQSMQEISQNFPNTASSLSRMRVNSSIKDEIIANQRMITAGKSLLAVNGALINVEDLDLYMLFDLIHHDVIMADKFLKLKIPNAIIQKLLAVAPSISTTMFRLDFRSSHTHFLNNLEEDPMYSRWRSRLNDILMPLFPGSLPYIRKNLFHAVFVVDPVSSSALEALDIITSMYGNYFPVRFGVVLYSSRLISMIQRDEKNVQDESEDISTLVIRLFMYIKSNHGIATAFKFLNNISKAVSEAHARGDFSMETNHVEGVFVETLPSDVSIPPQQILSKLAVGEELRRMAVDSTSFAFKLGFGGTECHLLMNGIVLDCDEDVLLNALSDELGRIQELVYYGHITSHTDILDKFLSESGVTHYNPQILTTGKPRFISLPTSIVGQESLSDIIFYLHSPGTFDDVKPVTHLLVVNPMSNNGIKLLREGLRYLIDSTKSGRIGVLFNIGSGADSSLLYFVRVFEVMALQSFHTKDDISFLVSICSLFEESFLTPSATDLNVFINKIYELAATHNLSIKNYRSGFSEMPSDEVSTLLYKVSQFINSELGFGYGASAVITNGRVTIAYEESFLSRHDLQLLESIEMNLRIKDIARIIEEVMWENVDLDTLTSNFLSDVIMVVSSSTSSRQRTSETAHFGILNTQHSAVLLPNENATIHIDAVIDPLSPSSQKLSSILCVIQKYIQLSLKIVLNPLGSLVDLPLRTYYRFVSPTMNDFSDAGPMITGARATFTSMPLSKTLTMNLDVPEPWLVEPVVAMHDLDNILLENLGDANSLQAVFELEALVLTGHCAERDNEPPRGLQLVLGTKLEPHLVDTLVMANLGYWQMKVSPGIWNLQLAPGRSSELYELKVDGSNPKSRTSLKTIVIDDLRGKIVHLEVWKKKGKERESLLVSEHVDGEKNEIQDGSWNKNLLKWASGIISGKNHTKRDALVSSNGQQHRNTINIFSVASGHLYERFLKIMILSVLKHTQRPVKFWFIKNYLSPHFKGFIPHMAREYGFEYEFITYKWPTWLHKQTEKQRIIWAYKILFLDVIFPLSLEKVIFVDADQIVRADMGELYDMDLKGRPLAYTPFCDNNKEMDGYRFWRQGFWRDHLRGKPYHISALFVVDLKKFREMAAGDNLRVFYETLSRDPNSLSNLDQDLPNYAQHVVPIFSLPQEWLWCESWCGNSTKAKAKTIDLCNNPMTKEPKLQGARRIVAEWPELDAEARQFTEKILSREDEMNEELAPKPSSVKQSSVEEVLATSTENLESKAEL